MVVDRSCRIWQFPTLACALSGAVVAVIHIAADVSGLARELLPTKLAGKHDNLRTTRHIIAFLRAIDPTPAGHVTTFVSKWVAALSAYLRDALQAKHRIAHARTEDVAKACGMVRSPMDGLTADEAWFFPARVSTNSGTELPATRSDPIALALECLTAALTNALNLLYKTLFPARAGTEPLVAVWGIKALATPRTDSNHQRTSFARGGRSFEVGRRLRISGLSAVS